MGGRCCGAWVTQHQGTMPARRIYTDVVCDLHFSNVKLHPVQHCVLCCQVPEDEDDTCELNLPSPLDMAEMVSSREEAIAMTRCTTAPICDGHGSCHAAPAWALLSCWCWYLYIFRFHCAVCAVVCVAEDLPGHCMSVNTIKRCVCCAVLCAGQPAAVGVW